MSGKQRSVEKTVLLSSSPTSPPGHIKIKISCSDALDKKTMRSIGLDDEENTMQIPLPKRRKKERRSVVDYFETERKERTPTHEISMLEKKGNQRRVIVETIGMENNSSVSNNDSGITSEDVVFEGRSSSTGSGLEDFADTLEYFGLSPSSLHSYYEDQCIGGVDERKFDDDKKTLEKGESNKEELKKTLTRYDDSKEQFRSNVRESIDSNEDVLFQFLDDYSSSALMSEPERCLGVGEKLEGYGSQTVDEESMENVAQREDQEFHSLEKSSPWLVDVNTPPLEKQQRNEIGMVNLDKGNSREQEEKCESGHEKIESETMRFLKKIESNFSHGDSVFYDDLSAQKFESEKSELIDSTHKDNAHQPEKLLEEVPCIQQVIESENIPRENFDGGPVTWRDDIKSTDQQQAKLFEEKPCVQKVIESENIPREKFEDENITWEDDVEKNEGVNADESKSEKKFQATEKIQEVFGMELITEKSKNSKLPDANFEDLVQKPERQTIEDFCVQEIVCSERIPGEINDDGLVSWEYLESGGKNRVVGQSQLGFCEDSSPVEKGGCAQRGFSTKILEKKMEDEEDVTKELVAQVYVQSEEYQSERGKGGKGAMLKSVDSHDEPDDKICTQIAVTRETSSGKIHREDDVQTLTHNTGFVAEDTFVSRMKTTPEIYSEYFKSWEILDETSNPMNILMINEIYGENLKTVNQENEHASSHDGQDLAVINRAQSEETKPQSISETGISSTKRAIGLDEQTAMGVKSVRNGGGDCAKEIIDNDLERNSCKTGSPAVIENECSKPVIKNHGDNFNEILQSTQDEKPENIATQYLEIHEPNEDIFHSISNSDEDENLNFLIPQTVKQGFERVTETTVLTSRFHDSDPGMSELMMSMVMISMGEVACVPVDCTSDWVFIHNSQELEVPYDEVLTISTRLFASGDHTPKSNCVIL